MKAVLLLAGFGSRLRPLTDKMPKALLPIGDSNALELMVNKLRSNGVESFIIVTGYRQEMISGFFKKTFPDLQVQFVDNPRYETTNTGYSLLCARQYVEGSDFIKLDGDVVFNEEIVKKLLSAEEGNYLCLDRSEVDNEVIKVSLDAESKVISVGKSVPLTNAAGESIGIERISATSSPLLFDCLKELMKDPAHLQSYYEVAYDQIIQDGQLFKTIDISGLRWVEMDTLEDYQLAQSYFS